jgi:hypothetical protein
MLAGQQIADRAHAHLVRNEATDEIGKDFFQMLGRAGTLALSDRIENKISFQCTEHRLLHSGDSAQSRLCQKLPKPIPVNSCKIWKIPFQNNEIPKVTKGITSIAPVKLRDGRRRFLPKPF